MLLFQLRFNEELSETFREHKTALDCMRLAKLYDLSYNKNERNFGQLCRFAISEDNKEIETIHNTKIWAR